MARAIPWIGLLALLCLLGCPSTPNSARESDDHGHPHSDDDSWAATSWGERFEIFAEADPLVAGGVSNCRTHVTLLEGFHPLDQGVVSAVLRDDRGRDAVFSQPHALREGIFDIQISPQATGEYQLLFRVEKDGGVEEIPSGRVRVGDRQAPGGLLVDSRGHFAVEEVSFPKEQQWNTAFHTAWALEDEIRETARGTGRVRPASSGEIHLAAPIGGTVVSEPWPFVGMVRASGEPILALSSRVSEGRTLSELQALDTEKRAALGLAQERLARLEGLLEAGAVSSAEVDAARANVQTLQAQAESARRQMASVRGAGGSAVLEVTAPFAGEVAEVLVRPGQAVSAGDALVRLVRVQPVWIQVHLTPVDAQRLRAGAAGLWVRAAGDRGRTLFDQKEVSLVSIAPEVSERTGRVACLIQVDPGESRLRLGSAVEAEILLAAAHEGVVIPASSIIDDAGIPVVFVQLDGETFERREITITGREGDRYLVTGLRAQERVVTRGGATIRRASLISNAGAGHGHVH